MRISGGRGRFSERSASPPRPLSPEERLAFGGCASAGLVPPERWGGSCCAVVVTAADRAAATYAARGTNPSARLRRAPPLSGEDLQAAPTKGFLRRGSCHARERMTEDTPASRSSSSPLFKRLAVYTPLPPSAEGGGPSAVADGGGYTLPPRQYIPQQKSFPPVSRTADSFLHGGSQESTHTHRQHEKIRWLLPSDF